MANALDGRSFVAVQWGGLGDYVIMPAMPGTSAVTPSGLQKIFLAGGSHFESVNFIRGLSMPMVDFIGIPHSQWFTAAHVADMFTDKPLYGLLNSIGKLEFGIGDFELGDYVHGEFSACYVPALTIMGGGRGTPITVRMGLMAAGVATSPFVTPGSTPVGDTGFFMSDGVTFGGLTDVLSWSLTLTNSMVPDTSCPGAAIVEDDLPIYPTGYINGPIGVALNVVQKAGASVIVDGSDLTGQSTIAIKMKETVASGTPAEVNFAFQGLIPDDSSQVTGGLSIISRSYVGQADADTPSIAIT